MTMTGVSLILFALLVFSVWAGIHLLVPLGVGLVLFAALAMRKGFKAGEVAAMMASGTEGIWLIVQIFILIGAITSAWMAAGTIPAIGYHGLGMLHPKSFLLFAFLMSAAMSFLLGTAFGTAGTMGVVLMVMARSGGVPTAMAGGAIIAGAYFGDRCSPMSSSANLIAVLTGTDLYANVRRMMETALVPLLMSVVFYGALSLMNPLQRLDTGLLSAMRGTYRMGIWAFVPALVLFTAAALRIHVRRAMALSVLSGCLVAVWYQGVSPGLLLKALMTGYRLADGGPLTEILKSGGVRSMITVSLTVLISAAYAGILDKAGLLEDLGARVEAWSRRAGLFPVTVLMAVLASAVGCTQTLAIIIVFQIMKGQKAYKDAGRRGLAMDLENSVVLLAPLVPWNIASAVPATAIGVGAGYIPFALYLYLVPLWRLFRKGGAHGSSKMRKAV